MPVRSMHELRGRRLSAKSGPSEGPKKLGATQALGRTINSDKDYRKPLVAIAKTGREPSAHDLRSNKAKARH
jgi:hypothetical protein